MMKEVVEKLVQMKKTISTMESCTGGYIASTITDNENASKVLSFSVVTYSNEAKIQMGVEEDVIKTYSVYSMEAADEMSKNSSRLANSSFGVGITGQINRKDEKNPTNEHDKVYISIYDAEKDFYYRETFQTVSEPRRKNKELICRKVEEMFLHILSL